ncbi:UNVERIFIED_CONTAM: hypothetical protein Sradi_6895600 [Sesamum radiatum]|uniref:Reverse transcriptase domain-containing protein n=1 Tax=Sesamum radiatum TaxID=300843 RepID=A0AAW2JJ39_SESRA
MFSISLNGCLHGFFAGARGLRQGDPVSPYLFVIVMEILHVLLKLRIQSEEEFRYHWKCSELGIINLCFADDVLIFCAGDLTSVRLISEVLEEFEGLSGLRVNPSKSTIILSKSVQQDRQILLNQVIEQRMRAFLWKGSTGSGLAKVSWDHVCKSKEEGGLGLRRVLYMNQALMLKNVWRLLQEDPNSIWVAWVLQYRLRRHSIWTPTYSHIPERTDLIRAAEGCSALDGNRQGQWCWPAETETEIQQIMAALPALHPQQSDQILWKQGMFYTIGATVSLPAFFSCHFRLLGGKFGIPRHNFILWLAFLERLSTLDRIWSSSMGQQCVLCGGQQVETHQHLFFRCSFTKRCLEILKRNVRFSWLNMGWQTDIIWASRRWSGRHLLNEASRALLASIVYHVWSERNSRIFSDTASSAETVACRALEEVRLRIISEDLKPSLQQLVLFRIWHIPWC